MESRSLEAVIRRPEPEKVVVVCRLNLAFRVDEADAALLPATHARTVPVESINGPESRSPAAIGGANRGVPSTIHNKWTTHQACVLNSVTNTVYHIEGTIAACT